MRLGVIGCGDAAFAIGFASRFVRRCSIAAAVDLDYARRIAFARKHRAKPVSDWRELLDDDLVDAVYLAVPHDLHRAMSLAFAEAGVAVLLEKPIAATLADARALVAESPTDAKIAVNYQYRYDPKVRALLEAVDRLGEIRYAQVAVPWYRNPRYFEHAGWHASKQRAGGGTLLTQGSHALDIALLACGAPAIATGLVYQRVHASTEVEDLAFGVVETDAGVPLSITSSMVSRPGEQATVTLYGEAGSLHYRGPHRARLVARGVAARRAPVYTQLHPYVASLAGFRDWVEGGPPPRCKLEDALPVMRAVDALYRSAELGRTVPVAR